MATHEEFVIKETRRPLSWFYNPDDRNYVRREDDGRLNTIINGVHLPDPYVLSDKLKVAAKGDSNARTSADPVTFELWNHWRKQNANLNS